MARRELSRGQLVGLTLATLQAGAIMWLAEDLGWSWRLSDWEGWPILSALVLIAAPANVFAWYVRLRWVAVPASLLGLFAPWGFIYFGPILAVGLGIGAVFLRPNRPAHTEVAT